ncbi:MAG: indolepyruvate ferredoxin oxidoreductase subunit alpha [Firmicutes bacterium]|nr:indolepyruvate ferredoxin oxidoreductase subunit alpha [Bacillota bacterium]
MEGVFALEKKLLTGNAAVARGFWEAGGQVVSSYPGTPSTEITECASEYPELYAEWAPNEKVAVEVAIGASISGVRALAAMKHVGVNVAADPLFTVSYTGVNGGLVFISADDPGMFSSQNEQDNRHYARAIKIPAVEPSDSAECLAFTKAALAISEQFDTPVMLRLTTRVAHGQTMVELGERVEAETKPYVKNPQKYVMAPANAKPKHKVVEARMRALEEFAETTELNRVEMADTKMGVICSGAVYNYVKEILPTASVLKLGMPYPLPKQKITDFAAAVDELYVIEELDPFYETIIKSWGIECHGKDIFALEDEILPETIAECLRPGECPFATQTAGIAGRPPVLCPGCPHRATFRVLSRLKVTVLGDIGCYTLAFAPPLAAMDTTVCMGASIGMAHGMEKALGREQSQKTVAVLGESTFIHSGISSLVNAVYNGSAITVMILDNSITAMTGHQPNAGSGKDIHQQPAPELDFAELAKACGVKHVWKVDPFDQDKLTAVVKEALEIPEVCVIVAERPCVLLPGAAQNREMTVVAENCIGCKACLRIGCPALAVRDGLVEINDTQCNGCGLCADVCPRGALRKGDAK